MAGSAAKRESNGCGGGAGLPEGKTTLARFVRTKDEINKDAILNEADLFAAGQVPGIRIVSGVEDFVVEPNDPDLAGV